MTIKSPRNAFFTADGRKLAKEVYVEAAANRAAVIAVGLAFAPLDAHNFARWSCASRNPKDSSAAMVDPNIAIGKAVAAVKDARSVGKFLDEGNAGIAAAGKTCLVCPIDAFADDILIGSRKRGGSKNSAGNGR